MLTSPGWRGPISQLQSLWSFTAGLQIGSLFTASALWLLGAPLRALPLDGRSLALVACGAALWIREMGWIHFRLPQNDHEVPQAVFAKSPRRAAFLFGLELGTGFRTFVSSSLPYFVLLVVALYIDDLRVVLPAGSAFAAGRALSAWIPALGFSRRRHWWDNVRVHTTVAGRMAMSSAVAGFVLIVAL